MILPISPKFTNSIPGLLPSILKFAPLALLFATVRMDATAVVPKHLKEFFPHVDAVKEMDPQLALIGPSRVQVNTPLDLQVVALGKDGEPGDLPAAPVVICEGPVTPDNADGSTTFAIELRRDKEGIYHPVAAPALSKPGYYRLTARDPGGVSLPCGLPIHATVDEPKLLLSWGDIHAHSTLSDGLKSPEEYYRWAHDVARMDIAALTDHNWALNDEKIAKIKSLAREWYQPGRFVTFLSCEWAPGEGRKPPKRGRPNHKNLYFRKVDVDFGPWIPTWHDTPTVAKLWELLKGHDVIAIPHHTGLPYDTFFGTDWSLHNEQFERLVEVFSDWGSSETPDDRYRLPEEQKGNFVRDALKRGYHLGFVGGSDSHGTRPGLNALPQRGHPYSLTALTCVESPARTRDSVWEALFHRRCYAASAGRRPLLEVTLNGAVMGSQIVDKKPGAPRTLTATVAGPADIREILIVKNGEPAAKFDGKRWCQRIEWTDPSPSPTGEDSYYVRAEFADTSMAWASPVWVKKGL